MSDFGSQSVEKPSKNSLIVTTLKKTKEYKQRISKYIGPGVISGIAGNDAGGIATFSIVGAAFGYKFLWLVVLAIPMFIVIQEMSMKLATKSKKGLGAMIRERYGAKISLLIIFSLFITNVTIVAANIGGVVAALELLTHIPAVWFVLPMGIFFL